MLIKTYGVDNLREDTGASLFAVLQWRTRDWIPGEHWPAIILGAKSRSIPDVTLEALKALKQRRRSYSGTAA